MNERIQEFVNECTEWVTGTIDGDYEYFDKEKFALLILKECITLFENAKVNQEDDVDYGLEEAQNIIKEHFGVEK